MEVRRMPDGGQMEVRQRSTVKNRTAARLGSKRGTTGGDAELRTRNNGPDLARDTKQLISASYDTWKVKGLALREKSVIE